MMADDKVTFFGNSFINEFFGYIQGNQCLTGLCIQITDLQASIVIALLPLKRCNLCDAVQNVFYSHKFKIEAQN